MTQDLETEMQAAAEKYSSELYDLDRFGKAACFRDFLAGARFGAEAMRERAAKVVDQSESDKWRMILMNQHIKPRISQRIAEDIRALPIGGDK